MKINLYEQTHQGCRANNQDCFTHIIKQNWGCFVVADGLGGHEKGEVAAQEFCRAVHSIAEKYAPHWLNDPGIAISELIKAAKDLMKEEIQQKFGFIDTQTTFALAWVDPHQVITAHIGDSRIYCLDPSQILWRTTDHSYAQKLFEEGKITESELPTHPSQHQLLKTLNLFNPPIADISIHSSLSVDQTILLCSDGFWASLNDEDFVAIAQAQNVAEKIQALIQKILIQRPHDADNITVQVLRLESS